MAGRPQTLSNAKHQRAIVELLALPVSHSGLSATATPIPSQGENQAADRSIAMILEIRRGQAKHRHRFITEPAFLVGVNADCDMVLGDPQFAPIHFALLNRDGETTIRCMGLKPEVTVNGVERTSGMVQPGDRIRTGSYEFILRAA